MPGELSSWYQSPVLLAMVSLAVVCVTEEAVSVTPATVVNEVCAISAEVGPQLVVE